MNRDEFVTVLRDNIKDGEVFQNPSGRGTSTILELSNERVAYMRGHSRIYVSIDDLFDAFLTFRNQKLSTSDLRSHAPEVFDSGAKPKSGHGCNCTVLFLLLGKAGLSGPITGTGRKGNCFSVEVK